MFTTLRYPFYSFIHEQNGAAERLNRTLMERVRAMLHRGQLDVDMSAEAAVTANFIRNKYPLSGRAAVSVSSSATVSQTSLTCASWDPKHMCTFPSSSELDSHSKPGIFVGYDANSKAYRVLLDDGNITVSRDVMFDEAQKHSQLTQHQALLCSLKKSQT